MYKVSHNFEGVKLRSVLEFHTSLLKKFNRDLCDIASLYSEFQVAPQSICCGSHGKFMVGRKMGLTLLLIYEVVPNE